jgi:hypothetical protein
MKNKIINFTFFLLSILVISCSGNTTSTKITKELTVENILDTIWTIKEVNERNSYVKEQSKNKRELMVYINGTPDELNEDYYWVKVAEDNGNAYFTHFDFFIYPNWSIKFYDRVKDKELTLDEWREELMKEK